jgi:proteasome lid subunit RPN8/RPN11
MNRRISITAEIMSCLVVEAQENVGEECCGLLAGMHDLVMRAFSAVNVAGEPTTAYEIAPQELFGLMREIRGAGLELLGIYHSHPRGDNIPSARDIERAYYPDAAYFIISPRVGAPNAVRAFSIRDGEIAELDVKIK